MPVSRRRLRLFTVIALIVVATWWNLFDLSRVFGFPLGTYGFSSNGSIVTRVERGGEADRAGVHVGDRIVVGRSDHPEVARYSLARGATAHAGDKLSVTVKSAAGTRDITLIAAPESPSQRAFVALRFALALLTVGVATVLLLTRPEPATWGFFLYCLTVITLPGAVLTYALPWSVRNATVTLSYALGNASLVGGVLFAWMFAGQKWTPSRRAVLGLTLFGAAIVTAIEWYGSFTGSAQPAQAASDAYSGFVLLMMLFGFIDSYHHDEGVARQRLKWMIAALLISVPALYASSWLFPGYLSYGQYVSLIAVQAVLPLSAAYAMFRKRVVDINFVISRTLVYATLTALLVAIFSLLDALLSRAFAESRVSLSIDIAVALLFGFSLNAAHHRIDAVIDRVLFRERHRAERRLGLAAAAIVHATDEDVVGPTLVRLPVELLRLTGAAFYRRVGATFSRQEAIGELTHLPDVVEYNDPLALCLRAELRPIRLDDTPLSTLRKSNAAVLAFPITMRGELTGLVVYGAHRNGADIDPDEERALSPLATNAAIAFDHLDAEALRGRIAVLEAMLSGQLTP